MDTGRVFVSSYMYVCVLMEEGMFDIVFDAKKIGRRWCVIRKGDDGQWRKVGDWCEDECEARDRADQYQALHNLCQCCGK